MVRSTGEVLPDRWYWGCAYRGLKRLERPLHASKRTWVRRTAVRKWRTHGKVRAARLQPTVEVVVPMRAPDHFRARRLDVLDVRFHAIQPAVLFNLNEARLFLANEIHRLLDVRISRE